MVVVGMINNGDNDVCGAEGRTGVVVGILRMALLTMMVVVTT